MKTEWQLQTAKNKLSQVVESAMRKGPQTITLRGRPAAVLVSVEDFKRLSGSGRRLSRFFAKSPLRGAGLNLARKTAL
ncbi:MAG: type II toxin-antitoxin system Phd/YefM family antitoxin [Elusimicrobia bacterium]|nr:type II toxin-antitoxin system Phd/YefM family antitoxin [Elusimicrobiota bacterium]